MEVLFAIFVVMIVISLGALTLLFINNGIYGNNNIVLIVTSIWSVFISWMSYTSLPVNYNSRPLIFSIKAVIASICVILAVISLFLGLKKEEQKAISKSLLSISIIGGMISLLM